MGYGTKLLQFAMKECVGTPTLWILENNTGADRLYRRMGFRETGRIHKAKDGLTILSSLYKTAKDVVECAKMKKLRTAANHSSKLCLSRLRCLYNALV